MPGMTGELVADFSDFQRAAQEATVALRGMETGGTKVEKSLNAVADSLSGRTLIQNATLMAEAVERIGGVSMLTEKELARVAAQAQEAAEKLRAVGQDVPANLQNIADQAKGVTGSFDSMKATVLSLAGAFGIGFSIDAIVGFGKEILNSAGALTQLSAKTGVSIEELQRMEAAGLGAGVSVESLAQASYKLGIAIEGGDKSVVDALKKLGLSWDDVSRMGSDDMMSTVVSKLEAVQSQTEKNKLGNDLYAGAWATIAPAIVQGYTDIANSAEVSSAAQIQAIDRAAATWDAWVKKQFNAARGAAGSALELHQAVEKLGDGYAMFLLQSDPSIKTIEQLNAALIKAAGAHDVVLPKVETHTKLTKDQQAASDKMAAAMVELNAAGTGWQGTLAAIDGETVEMVTHYLEAGVSQTALATAYSLTDVQVKAIATSITDAAKATTEWAAIEKAFTKEATDHFKEQGTEQARVLKLRNQAVLDGNEQIMAASAKYHDAEMKASMDTTTYQITKIWERAKAEVDAFKGTEEQAATHAEFIYSVADQEARAITDVMASAVDQMAGKAIDGVNKVRDEAQAAVASMQGGTSLPGSSQMTAAGGQRYLVSPDGNRVPIGPHGELPANWFELYSGQTSFQGRAAGGPVSAGQPYVVGERGPELFVPSGGGAIVPGAGGGGGGGGVTNNYYITQPLGTPEAIARAIGQANLSVMRGQGVRLPYGT